MTGKFVVGLFKFKTIVMKKYSINASKVLLFMVTIIGCKKFITKDIVGQYPEGQFYTTAAQALLAINAAYQPLALQVQIITGYGYLVMLLQMMQQKVEIPAIRLILNL